MHSSTVCKRIAADSVVSAEFSRGLLLTSLDRCRHSHCVMLSMVALNVSRSTALVVYIRKEVLGRSSSFANSFAK